MARKKQSATQQKVNRGFAYVAFWQFMSFLVLLLLVWVNEVLDLASLVWGTGPMAPSLFRGCVLSSAVLIVAIITVGHTYEQQKRIVKGILTVCSDCRKVRIEQEDWEQIEEYVSKHSEIMFTHGLCPSCYEKRVAELDAVRQRSTAGGFRA